MSYGSDSKPLHARNHTTLLKVINNPGTENSRSQPIVLCLNQEIRTDVCLTEEVTMLTQKYPAK